VNVELNVGIEFNQFDEVGLAEVAGLRGRMSFERLSSQFRYGSKRPDLEILLDVLRRKRDGCKCENQYQTAEHGGKSIAYGA
jgi:hypothetical protein